MTALIAYLVLYGDGGVGNPIFVGLVVGIPTSVLGYLAYRRAEKLDRLAVSSTLLTARSEEAKLVSEAQANLIENLRNDNRDLREFVERLRAEIHVLRDEIAGLRADLANAREHGS